MKRKIVPLIAGLVVAITLVAIGYSAGQRNPVIDGAKTGSAVGPTTSAGAPIVTAAPRPTTVAPTTPPGPATTFGAGLYEVGVDIKPGKYKSTGPDDTNFVGCYYSRTKENDGSVGDIIDNNISKGPSTVTIRESDGYFETNGCDTWVLQ